MKVSIFKAFKNIDFNFIYILFCGEGESYVKVVVKGFNKSVINSLTHTLYHLSSLFKI